MKLLTFILTILCLSGCETLVQGIVTAPILMYDEAKTHPEQPRKEGR